MSSEPLGEQVLDSSESSSLLPYAVYVSDQFEENLRLPLSDDQEPPAPCHGAGYAVSTVSDSGARAHVAARADGAADRPWIPLSPWSRSTAKRLFDCVSVILAAPVVMPLIVAIGVAVRFTSRGPVFFLQERMGRHGRPFTILKFRTLVHVADKAHHPITTADNQCFTPIGPFLRRWKLDELPQLANVLLGHMSLVGPRPKLREHVISDLPCRPGITGMASTVFANEETVLARIPRNRLDACFHAVVLPAKRQLDIEYMARATFFSDLRILVNSVLRRWETPMMENLILAALEMESESASSRNSEPSRSIAPKPIPNGAARPA